ncbi:MAG: hypothetical protein NVSMB4_00490 [Acidimicrobiales bacterium]
MGNSTLPTPNQRLNDSVVSGVDLVRRAVAAVGQRLEDSVNWVGTMPADGQVPTYNVAGGGWVPAAAGGGKIYASVVVAASDSSHATTAVADFVATATTAETAINAAIAALPAAGGTVLLMEGTYNITTAAINVNKANVNLVGMGWGTLIRKDPGGTFAGNMIQLNAQNQCQVIGVRMSGTGVGINVLGGFADYVIERVMLSGFSTGIAWGTDLAGSIHGKIHHNTLYSCGTGVTVPSGDAVSVTDNYLQSCTTAIRSQTGDIVIAGNTIEGGTTGILVDGNAGFGLRQILVSHNIVSGVATTGININFDGVIVDGNWVGPGPGVSASVGIVVNATDVHVFGNNVNAFRTANIQLGASAIDCYVHDNVVKKYDNSTSLTVYSQIGISVLAGATSNLIINNDIKNGGVTPFSDLGTTTKTNLDGSANNWNRVA